MRVIRKEDISNIIKNPKGEEIYEMIGPSKETGESSLHSLVHVVIPPGKSSQAHFHEVSEETYYILKGVGQITLNGEKLPPLRPGDACLIKPGVTHQIFNEGEDDLEFLTICAPAWTPDDSFPPAEEKLKG